MILLNKAKNFLASITKDSALSRYWLSYGGLRSLLRSPYFWTALILTLALYPAWSQPGWWNDVITIMPSLLGFSLGGYALWLAIGDDEFRKLISGSSIDGKPSPYMKVNATFAHFIILQITATIIAILAKTYYFKLSEDNPLFILTTYKAFHIICGTGYFLGYFIFIYALLSALAATLALFRVSSWYDIHQGKKK